MNFTQVAQKEFRNFHIFSDLSKKETNPEFKRILEELAAYEEKHYQFWQNISLPKAKLVKPRLWWYHLLRFLFGITFIIRHLEQEEGDMIKDIRDHLAVNDHPNQKAIENLLDVDEAAEQKLLHRINEERVEFMGSIVLGLNDGLIELSGALTGFTFAFAKSPTIILAGFILGISASLSMGSSAYLSARHEKGKNPTKSALYTGIAYMVVVILLIAPYLVFGSNILLALANMILGVILIVIGLSYYTSTVFGRRFKDDFLEMFTFSIGTAFISFLISTAARSFLGIEV